MGWKPFFPGRLIMAYKNLPIGVDVDFHLRALKFKWSQLQDAPSCSKGGIRGWWEGVKGFRRGGVALVEEILAAPATHWDAPHLKQRPRFGVPGAQPPPPGSPTVSRPRAVIRSRSGPSLLGYYPRAMPRGGGGRSRRGGGESQGPLCTSGAIGSSRFSSPRFCSHSCVHSARDPPSDP